MQEKKGNFRLDINKIILLFLALVLITFYFASGVLAKYTSSADITSDGRVAKYGNLNLYEYTVEGNRLVTGESAQVENIDIYAGADINKNLSISFSGSEVAVYIFLVISSEDWVVTKNDNMDYNRISIKNNYNDDIIYWDLDDDWKYLAEESTSSKQIFYHFVKPNTIFDENIISEIKVNSISFGDAKLIKNNDYSLSFKSYAVSASGVTPQEAWGHAETSN